MMGWGFLHISIIWIMTAQYQMANSWRIGIDSEQQTELITSGLFAHSRNPIFLGILIANFGLFLVIPNAVTLLIGGLSFFAIQVQVRLEEVHLMQVNGREYGDYVSRVGRWVSW
jgi:protein-S-isoprenylcysteine O-methyltransferase Ste14